MKRAKIERNIAAILFMAVLAAFSFAHRDTQKLDRLYTQVISAGTQVILSQSAAPDSSSN